MSTKELTWKEMVKEFTSNITVSRDKAFLEKMEKISKDPYFVKKLEDAKEDFRKYRVVEQYKNRKLL